MLEYEYKYWLKGFKKIAGIDESGRGPLAGPVIACAVVFPQNIDLPHVNDSKKISPRKRDSLFNEIKSNALSIGIGIVDEETIDKINIQKATHRAMQIAVENLSLEPDILLVDGYRADIKNYKQESILKGDSKSLSIAAASIIAKVTRDRIMNSYDLVFPQYGFKSNKGYGTKKHIEAIKDYFICPIHRKTFRPASNYIQSIKYYEQNNFINELGRQLAASSFIKDGHEIILYDKIKSLIVGVDFITFSLKTIFIVSVSISHKKFKTKYNDNVFLDKHFNELRLFFEEKVKKYEECRYLIVDVFIKEDSYKIKINKNKLLSY